MSAGLHPVPPNRCQRAGGHQHGGSRKHLVESVAVRFQKSGIDGCLHPAPAHGTSLQRAFDARTKPVLVEQHLASLRIEQWVDLLGREPAVRLVEERSGRALHAIVHEKLIHRIVARAIPAPANPVTRPIEMQQCAVQRFVGEHELRFREGERIDVAGVEIERPRIGRYRATAPSRDKGQMERQRAEKRTLEHEARTGRVQLGVRRRLRSRL